MCTHVCQRSTPRDRDVVLVAVAENGKALDYASPELRNDRDVVLVAIKNEGLLEYASEALQADRDVVLQWREIVGHWIMPRHWSMPAKRSKADRDFMLAAVALSGQALMYASGALE